MCSPDKNTHDIRTDLTPSISPLTFDWSDWAVTLTFRDVVVRICAWDGSGFVLVRYREKE